MKNLKKLLLLSISIFTILSFSSCEMNKAVERHLDLATVVADSQNNYFLQPDNSDNLLDLKEIFPSYSPVLGQRMIVDYVVLEDGSIEAYLVQTILTKFVEDLTAENESDFGNDEIKILHNGMWISSNHLNIEFLINSPLYQKHKISLVKNTQIVYEDDGYLHLELRYNTYNDITPYIARGVVSFNLGKEDVVGDYKGVKLNVNIPEEGVKEVTFEFGKEEDIEPKYFTDMKEYLN